MKKLLLLSLIYLVFAKPVSHAQHCSSHEMLQKEIAENPERQHILDQLEAQIQAYLKEGNNNKGIQATKIIPMVFHIIHNGGNENISLAQIQDQVKILNAEFKRNFADTVKTPAPFKSLAGTIDVEFRLATKDPNGNCTQGVTRTYHPFSVCSANEQDVKAIQYWPSNKYLNIWLVSSMHYAGQSGCGGGGYAQFPGGNALTDGINIRADLIGSIGTAVTNSGWGNFLGRYLIHELGHWFNLRHIWGDQTCGDDLISDTPPHEGSNSGCPNFPWRPNNSCGSSSNGEMFTNYMDYTNGPCLNMFSKLQAARAEAAIAAPASGRNNLWTPANLAATGADQTALPDCPANPEIFPYVPKILCNTGSHTIRDASYGGTKTSRLWTVPGGQASSLTDSIISVSYSQPGVYSVSLENTNANGSKSRTFFDRVVVLDNSAPINSSLPYTESFEDNSFPANWVRVNVGGDTTWRVTGVASYTGNNSLRLRNFTMPIGSMDELITPRFDLSNTSAANMKFRLAFTGKSNANKDKLVIFISRDCGQTWTSVYSKMVNNSSTINELRTTTGNSPNAFIPADASQWREETINIAANFRTDNVRFRFVFTSSGGNNLYIDDVKVDGTVVVSNKNQMERPEIELIPNPAQTSVQFSGFVNVARFSIHDLQGRMVMEGMTPPESPVEIGNLSPGLYFWFAESDKGKVSGRLIKE